MHLLHLQNTFSHLNAILSYARMPKRGTYKNDREGLSFKSFDAIPSLKKFALSSQELREKHPELGDDELLRLSTIKFADEQPKNRLWYRINATKQLGGNPKLVPRVDAKLEQVS